MSTLGQTLAKGDRITVYCDTQGCGNSQELDLPSLVERYGPDQPDMHDDLIKLFHCSRCRVAGRPDKDIRFILNPNTKPYRWREMEAEMNGGER